MVIGIFTLSVLGECHFGPCVVVDLGEPSGERLCLAFFRGVYSEVWLEVEFGVHTIVREERRKPSSLRDVVVCGELGEG
jgi:hypothetical protein